MRGDVRRTDVRSSTWAGPCFGGGSVESDIYFNQCYEMVKLVCNLVCKLIAKPHNQCGCEVMV